MPARSDGRFTSSAHQSRYKTLAADQGLHNALVDYTRGLDFSDVRDGKLTWVALVAHLNRKGATYAK